MDYSIKDAFKALSTLDEDLDSSASFKQIINESINEDAEQKPQTEELKEAFVDLNNTAEVEEAVAENKDKEEEEKIEQVVDVAATVESDLKGTYIGNLILQCPTCHTFIYKSVDELEKFDEIPDEEPVYNVGEECPHCGAKDGFELIGQVAKLDTEETRAEEAEPEQPAEAPLETLDIPVAEPAPEEPVEESLADPVSESTEKETLVESDASEDTGSKLCASSDNASEEESLNEAEEFEEKETHFDVDEFYDSVIDKLDDLIDEDLEPEEVDETFKMKQKYAEAYRQVESWHCRNKKLEEDADAAPDFDEWCLRYVSSRTGLDPERIKKYVLEVEGVK